MTVVCTEFKPLRKGALHGFAVFELQPTGLRLRDCTVMEASGRRWIGLPGKPQITAEKTVRVVDGKAQYVAIVEWTSRERADAFKAAALAALLEFAPAAFDGEAAA
jgi:hypothetical protein